MRRGGASRRPGHPAARQCTNAPCWASPGRAAGAGGLSRRVVDLQALEKKGISHLEEKELKERNKRIQEDNRLELQKVGRPGPPHAAGRPPLAGPQGWFTPA